MPSLRLQDLRFFWWLLLIPLTGCEVVEGIFKFGFWTAIILVVVVVALGIWLLRRFRG